ncbi:MAG: YicC/YloC family endoribonuclease [Aquisalimonadaceae bacterium]
MARSMTAFERRECAGDWGKLSWELRSVNHRYLDVSLRMPEEMRHLETAARERVGKRLARGKVECSLRYQPAVGQANVRVNWPYAEQLIAATSELAGRIPGTAARLSALDLMRFPGVMTEAERDLEPVAQAALKVLDEALSGFVEAREREGGRLAELIRERADRIAELAAEVRTLMPVINARVREKLEARLADLEQPADPGRLEQELVYVAQRMDVEEELDRLETHVTEICRVLGRSEPIGRRLDFLMQELNREANTLGSKSAAVDTTRVSVDMKVLIEQMREQIQNLE